MNVQKIQELNRLFRGLNNKKLDWYIASWKEKGREKNQCLEKMKEYEEKCQKVVEEMQKYV